MAQGTIRPWSERGFFLLFYELFATNALPYRILVFATQIANLLLVSWIVLRLTSSRLATLLAPVLWTANSVLSTAMSWTSDYNEIQCAFFLLAAFALYLQDRYWLQFAVFLLGFGALELNLVYPAIVLAYVLATLPTKSRILRTVPLFAVSVAYYLLHAAVAPNPHTGPYTPHFDSGLLATFGIYWQYALIPAGWALVHHHALALGLTILFTAILLGHVAIEARHQRWLPLFFLLWFAITLAPLLPFRDHVSDYYLTIPALGLALLWADVCTAAARPLQALAAVAALIFVSLQIPFARSQSAWFLDRSLAARNLVLGVRQAHTLHPNKIILLANIGPDLALTAIAHSPFHALNIEDVYLTPQTEQELGPSGALPAVEKFILPAGPTLHGLAAGQIEVYSAGGPRLHNITSLYSQLASQTLTEKYPQRVDVGVPLMAYLLGSTWYPAEGNYRWMPRRASLRMGVPRNADSKLTLSGFCPSEFTTSAPLGLTISIDGRKLAQTQIVKHETSFSRTFALPAGIRGKEYVDVGLELDRVFRKSPSDRELGLAFGTFQVQ